MVIAILLIIKCNCVFGEEGEGIGAKVFSSQLCEDVGCALGEIIDGFCKFDKELVHFVDV